jgi:hypothetical protein
LVCYDLHYIWQINLIALACVLLIDCLLYFWQTDMVCLACYMLDDLFAVTRSFVDWCLICSTLFTLSWLIDLAYFACFRFVTDWAELVYSARLMSTYWLGMIRFLRLNDLSSIVASGWLIYLACLVFYAIFLIWHAFFLYTCYMIWHDWLALLCSF